MSDLTLAEYDKHHADITDAVAALNEAINRAKAAGITTNVTRQGDVVRVSTSAEVSSTSAPEFVSDARP